EDLVLGPRDEIATDFYILVAHEDMGRLKLMSARVVERVTQDPRDFGFVFDARAAAAAAAIAGAYVEDAALSGCACIGGVDADGQLHFIREQIYSRGSAEVA